MPHTPAKWHVLISGLVSCNRIRGLLPTTGPFGRDPGLQLAIINHIYRRKGTATE